MITILAPIRYPLTDESIRTLRHAAELAAEEPNGELLVLHVNLYQLDSRAQRSEIARAIKPIVGEVEATLLLRNAFFIEEAIADEAVKVGADRVVVGKKHRSRWRHLLSRLFGNGPDISAHLHTHTDAMIDVVG